jgi:DUF4097 and DUF4098 domain-containing protein YvlB
MQRLLIPFVIALSFTGAAFSGTASAADDISKVNGSVTVASGEHAGEVSTVNGSIHIADNAQVQKAGTVNGGLEMGDNATAGELHTVNGAITIGSKGRVTGTVEAVNGSIHLDQGSDVAGHLSNVNGAINLDAAHVAGGVETTAGDINIGANSRVEGGILVNKPHNSWFGFSNQKPPRIVIGPGAVVKGTLDFEREVELHISDRATVGQIKGATATKFSGASP